MREGCNMGIGKRAWQVAGAAAGGASLFGGGVAIGRLLRLDSQRGDYRRSWENHNLATLERLRQLDEHPRGGAPLPDRLPRRFFRAGDGCLARHRVLPARLDSAITQQMDREVLLLNLSLSGATIESVELTQLPQMRGLGLLDGPYRPDLVTLTIGGNDVMAEDMAPRPVRGAFCVGSWLRCRPVPSSPRSRRLALCRRRAARRHVRPHPRRCRGLRRTPG